MFGLAFKNRGHGIYLVGVFWRLHFFASPLPNNAFHASALKSASKPGSFFFDSYLTQTYSQTLQHLTEPGRCSSLKYLHWEILKYANVFQQRR